MCYCEWASGAWSYGWIDDSKDATSCKYSQEPTWECWTSLEKTMEGVCCPKMVTIVWRVWERGYQSQYV
jgi:hypothetical protein